MIKLSAAIAKYKVLAIASALVVGSGAVGIAVHNNVSLAPGAPASVTVRVTNGAAEVRWESPAGAQAITGYTVTLTPTYNDRPLPTVSSVVKTVSASSQSWTFSGLLEDCHQRYEIKVAAETANGLGAGTTTSSFRPSGIITSSTNDDAKFVAATSPPFVVILLDGIGESKPYFSMDPYQPTQDGNPSYCPESWNGSTKPPSEAEADFKGAPTGPWEFFNKWNFNATGDDSGESTPRDYATGEETHSFMLDAIAAQGAIILPYSYRGVTLTNPCLSSGCRLTFNAYSKCNSTPNGGAPGVNLPVSLPDSCVLDTGPNGNRQSIDEDVALLQDEVSKVAATWPKSRVVIMGHSQGGLIAFQWWKQHRGDSMPQGAKGVTNLFSLDSPINGVCVVPVVCTLGPEGYPAYGFRTLAGPDYLAADGQADEPFRFLGTWGEKVLGYGSGNDTLQVQLLVTGSNCGDLPANYSDCPAPPDHISGCPITGSNWWITGQTNYHFVVKWCPDDVNYFNHTLGLEYFPAPIATAISPTPTAPAISTTPTMAGGSSVTTDTGLSINVLQTPHRQFATNYEFCTSSCIELDIYLGFRNLGRSNQEVTDELPNGALGSNSQWQLIDRTTGQGYPMYTEGAVTGLCTGGGDVVANSTIPLDAICFDRTLQSGACFQVPNKVPWFIYESDLTAPLTLRYTDGNGKTYDIDLGTANGPLTPPSPNRLCK